MSAMGEYRFHERDAFASLVHPLMEMPVSRAWQGHGSALFLELGRLQAKGKNGSLCGESHLSLEWEWRLEQAGRIHCGSSDSRPRIGRETCRLQGTRIEHLELTPGVPELIVSLTGGWVLRSMVMTADVPQWTILLRETDYLSVARDGRLQVGNGPRGESSQEREARAWADATAERWGQHGPHEKNGRCCRDCRWQVRLDQGDAFWNYGVCTCPHSSHDGKAVFLDCTCPAFFANDG